MFYFSLGFTVLILVLVTCILRVVCLSWLVIGKLYCTFLMDYFLIHEKQSFFLPILLILLLLSWLLQMLYCTSLNWSADGSTLYAGYTDGTIRIYKISGFSYAG